MTERSARGVRRLLSLVNRKQLRRVLSRMLDETEFLSPHGVRALSRYHLDHPYEVTVNGNVNRVQYEPAESTTGMFGGNSNWRGPDMVSGQLSTDRVAAKVSSLLRRGFQSRVPHALRHGIRPMAGGRGDFAAARENFPAWRRWPASRIRRHGNVPVRSLLEGFDSVLRVFSRRQRRGYRRESPDGMDGTGRQDDRTER